MLTEVPPEVPMVPLDPLPLTKVENYPQENGTYFATKKYTRNDKYNLESFLHKDIVSPTI